MNPNTTKRLVFSLATGGLLLTGLFLLLNGAPPIARADPGDLFVTPGGGGDCSQSNPCDLQTALGAATDGDTIYLGAGTYVGSGGAVVTVTHSITLTGGWDGTATTPVVRDPGAYPTTLDGEGSRRVVHINGDIAPTIDGFIITGGEAEDGGGIYIYRASPTIQNNVITANRTIDGGAYTDGRGGGIYVGGSSAAIIAQNRILSNTSGYGGGIYHKSSIAVAITITSNEIVGNIVSGGGGGIILEKSPNVIQNNVISGNSADGDGGGIFLWNAAPQIEANRIVNNSAFAGGGIWMGNNSTPSLMNNLLIRNTRDGLFVGDSSPMAVNNTIVGSGLPNIRYGIALWSNSGCSSSCTTGEYVNNIVASYEVGIYGTGSITPVIDYDDVWGNTTADYALPAGVVTGTHNISLDPLFANPAAGNYHLQADSPCVDAGDPAGVPPAPSTDVDGDSRPFGDGVDIGADELRLWYNYLPVVVRDYT